LKNKNLFEKKKKTQKLSILSNISRILLERSDIKLLLLNASYYKYKG